jgi:hypothetical protein
LYVTIQNANNGSITIDAPSTLRFICRSIQIQDKLSLLGGLTDGIIAPEKTANETEVEPGN